MSNELRELRFGPWRALVCRPWVDALSNTFESLALSETDSLDDLALSEAPESGRRQAFLLKVDDGPRVHLRPCAHGGALARWTGTRFSRPHRFAEELRVHAALYERGVPLPEPAFALWRRRNTFYEGAVATRFIDEACDGLAFLESLPDATQLDRVASALARAVRTLHEAGGEHADLHVKNVLVSNGEDRQGTPEVHLLDLDRARISSVVTPKRRMHELMRFARSLRKRGHADAMTKERQRRFLDAYCDGGLELRRSMLAHLGREQLRTGLHALFHPRVAR